MQSLEDLRCSEMTLKVELVAEKAGSLDTVGL